MRSVIFFDFSLLFLIAVLTSSAQTDPHRISSISNSADSAVTLSFAGSSPLAFRSYFDLFPLESGSELGAWTFITTLLRTNVSTVAPVFRDLDRSNASRFYRTPAGPLPTPFLTSTGIYPVGAISMLLTDPTRSNRYNITTNSSFMITIWYPARPTVGPTPSLYIESKLTSSFAGLYGVAQSTLAAFRAPTYDAAPLASNAAPYPLIVYSHGFKVSRRDNTSKCEELASHGYIVVAVDHADCLATVFPDNRMLTTTISSLSQTLFDNDVLDIKFLLEELTELNASDPRFKNSMNLQSIGTMGWSYGGGVAAEFCRTDPRVKATVLLEAYLQNAHDVAFRGVQKPLLGLYNSTSAFTTPFDQNLQDAYWMRVLDADHQTFADWRGWISSPTLAHRQAAIAMNTCIVSFFNKHLKAHDDHLLDNPSVVYPQLTNFQKK